MDAPRSFQPTRLVFGFVLLAVGALLLAGSLGYAVPRHVWQFWPFLLLGLGITKVLWPGKRDDRRGGYWLIVTGLYGWINVWNLFGLDWGSSWPIYLVAAGLLILFEGVPRRGAPAGEGGDGN